MGTLGGMGGQDKGDAKRPLPRGLKQITFRHDGDRYVAIHIECDVNEEVAARMVEAALAAVRDVHPLTFQRDPPKRDGFYWYRPEGDEDLILVSAQGGIGYLYSNGERMRMTDMHGQWWPEEVGPPTAAIRDLYRLRLVGKSNPPAPSKPWPRRKSNRKPASSKSSKRPNGSRRNSGRR